jgi:hypothetical protein
MSEGATDAWRWAMASFHPVAGGGVLFDAAQGRLYALNPAAGMTWLCIRDGLSGDECTLALSKAFEIDPAMAAEWVRVSMDSFQYRGLLETVGSREAPPAPRTTSPNLSTHGGRRVPSSEYRLFEHILYLYAPPGPLAALESLLAALRSDPAGRKEHGCPEIGIDIVAHGDRWDIAVGGQLSATCDMASIVAQVERLLVQRVVAATPHLLTLHGAALQRDDRPLLLAGPSGAGKTTLSLALARAGWSFGSDEIVLLGRDQKLRALPLPPCVKASSFPLIESWFPELRSTPEHERYGHIVKYLPIRSMPLSAVPGSVVFLRFDPPGPNEIQPLDRFAALERLLAQCVFVPPEFQHDDVAQLLRWHSEQSYYVLSFCDCDAAVAILKHLDARPWHHSKTGPPNPHIDNH